MQSFSLWCEHAQVCEMQLSCFEAPFLRCCSGARRVQDGGVGRASWRHPARAVPSAQAAALLALAVYHGRRDWRHPPDPKKGCALPRLNPSTACTCGRYALCLRDLSLRLTMNGSPILHVHHAAPA